jgi:hypothetical protein
MKVVDPTKPFPRIKTLMKQLLFRLNQQQFRNAKYKKKTPVPADSQSEPELGHKTAIEVPLSQNIAAPIAQMVPNHRGHTDIAKMPINKSCKSSEASKSGTTRRSSATKLHDNIPKPADIYEVPLFPEPHRSSVSLQVLSR